MQPTRVLACYLRKVCTDLPGHRCATRLETHGDAQLLLCGRHVPEDSASDFPLVFIRKDDVRGPVAVRSQLATWMYEHPMVVLISANPKARLVNPEFRNHLTKKFGFTPHREKPIGSGGVVNGCCLIYAVTNDMRASSAGSYIPTFLWHASLERLAADEMGDLLLISGCPFFCFSVAAGKDTRQAA